MDTEPARRAQRVERVVLYGHDTMGLGHVRRNLALASALRAGAGSGPAPEVLVVTGVAEAGRFPLPHGVDLLVLPGVTKGDGGGYRSRRWDADLEQTVGLRRAVLTAALTAWKPHLLVVDKVARGFADELTGVLPSLRAAGTRVVLGLRDILDTPAAAAHEWRRLGTSEALRAWYDEVWVYGDRRVADLALDCRVPPSVERMLRYTGLLAAGRPSAPAGPVPAPGRFALCLLGGGQDGAELALRFARAPRPAGVDGVVVTGPHLPAPAMTALASMAAADPGLHVVEFCADPLAWAGSAEAVVCMGGYNTVAELLTTDTPVLVVPRVRPRGEQLLRARRLSALGMLDEAHPDDATPGVLGGWLAGSVGRRHPRDGIALDGLAQVRALAGAQLSGVLGAA